MIGLALAALCAGEAQAAATPRGPSHQQIQCNAEGGSFSAGYGADTYICVSLEGQVQTCRFGQGAPVCTVEDGVVRNRGPRHNQAGQSGSPMQFILPFM